MSLQDVKDKKPLKILVVAGAYPPNHGGGGLRVHRTYKRVSQQVHLDISVLTFKTKEYYDDHQEYEGVHIYRVNPNKSILYQFMIVGKLILNHELNKNTIMHGVGASIIVIVAVIWAKLLSMKIIREKTVTINDDYISQITKIKRWLNIPRYYYWLRYSYRCADMLIAISYTIKKYYNKIGIDDRRILTRPNPVDTNIFSNSSVEERDNIRNSMGISHDKIVCITVGKIGPRKNQKFIVDLALNTDVEFMYYIIGPVSESYYEYYEEMIKTINKNDIAKRVIVDKGYQKNIVKYFKAADILLLPSASEGMPNVLLEALCCGLPAIVNKRLELENIVIDGFNGWNVDLENSIVRNILHEKIKSLLSRSMRETISMDAQTKYSANKLDQLFLNKLESIHNFGLGVTKHREMNA
jgi:glycosyltransferase involved in cell wall biosynthesis